MSPLHESSAALSDGASPLPPIGENQLRERNATYDGWRVLPSQLVAHTRPLRESNYPYDFPRDAWCHILGTKYLAGNAPVDGTLPLAIALLEPWETDVHITQYVSTSEVRAVKSDVDSYQLRFDFCLFDLDFDNHGERPTLDDFATLITHLSVLDHVPNICYQTRGGARLVFLIEPVSDAHWFEDHYTALMRKIEEPLVNANRGYRLDTAVKDWTRLFRSARVVRDGVVEFDREIRVFHTKRLNLGTFRVKKKPVRKVTTGNMPFTAHDPKLLELIRSKLVPGNRNNALFSALCHVYRYYSEQAAERWINAIREAAIDAGIDVTEFESINKSAQKQPRIV